MYSLGSCFEAAAGCRLAERENEAAARTLLLLHQHALSLSIDPARRRPETFPACDMVALWS
jgi:hypothetical protein